MKKIVILEDDTDTAEIVKLGFGSLYSILVISDLIGILNKIHDFLPDLIITDYVLGQYVSTEIIEKIRDIDHFKTTPVILLTGHPNIEKIATEINASNYLMKPFSLKDLHRCVTNSFANNMQDALSRVRQ